MKICELCGAEYVPDPRHAKRQKSCSRKCRNALVSRTWRARQTTRDRFEQFCEYIPFTGCIVWMGGGVGDVEDYGKFRMDGRNVFAHRAAWEIYVGPIPDGMRVLHTCDYRRCVNYRHLFLGTMSDNTVDAIRKGRHRGLFDFLLDPEVQRRASDKGAQVKRDLTHCKHGHEFTPDNTAIFLDAKGRKHRDCIACRQRRESLRSRVRSVASAAALLLALSGCAGLSQRGPVTVSPLWGCRGELWKQLQATADTSTPEGWVKVADAVENAPTIGACCLMPSGVYQFCPKELGLTDEPMAQVYLKRAEERRKAALAQQQTPTTPPEQAQPK